MTFDTWYNQTNPTRNVKVFDGPNDYIYNMLRSTPIYHGAPVPVYHTGSAHTSNHVYLDKRTVHLWLFLHEMGVRPK